MSTSKSVEKNQFVFSKNIDFTSTPLNEVKVEYIRKKVQLNWAKSIVKQSTDDLFQYVLMLEEHIKVLEASIIKKKLELRGSVKLCNVLIATSFCLFLLFGVFSMLTNSVPLLLITLINGFVLGIIYLYRLKRKKKIDLL